MHKHTFWYVFQKLRHVWVSYISWYVLGVMNLTCLSIFAWQWGRKHNDIEKNAAFWVKQHSCLFYDSMVCFFYQSVYFLPMVFIGNFITTLCFYDFCIIGPFITTLCFYDFCKTVLVRKCTPCQGVVWFSPSKCHIFHTGF